MKIEQSDRNAFVLVAVTLNINKKNNIKKKTERNSNVQTVPEFFT